MTLQRSRTRRDFRSGSVAAADEAVQVSKDSFIAENKSGQVLGEKGRNTRSRVIAATRSVLEASGGLVPSAAAIARAAGVSSPTFYLYFKEVGEAILAVIEQMADELNPVLDMLSDDWPPETLYDHAHAFVVAYYDYWIAHTALLRVRNQLADEGDGRFSFLRAASALRLSAALTPKLAQPETRSGVVVARRDLASVLVIALERAATVRLVSTFPNLSPNLYPNQSQLISALALLIANAMRRE
jgi:AcrR family transcriptional regulator